uniref:Ascorbate oxidase n=2 Tax=Oryza sativa subsp. japonica TaxID=39947 RepID=Q7G293_ORYSJ|nr:putative pollen specific protein [Oryza sativa Japonica Group]AAM95677.1 putative ascorbate oxidase [Oryza sativa Japonica Group]AAP54540.1 multi-copper oxidase type I family protein, putative [Oryza sativa Japonica Group]
MWRALAAAAAAVAVAVVVAARPAAATDPYAFFDWDVGYVTAAPLGVKQQAKLASIILLGVIGINGKFPGPTVNISTNWNVVVNVLNDLDEPLLITWNGIQHRKNCWQDGVLGTNCPIPSGWNWTYEFQVKDQIGSFFYFPSTGLQRAAGGYGGVVVNNRDVIAVPFGRPDGDITIFIGDWYNKNHTDLRKMLDSGKDLGMPDGVLINGKGPYRYNDSLVPAGIEYETINVDPGKTYRIRVHNVGTSTSLNFRIQGHNMVLVETEGSYTTQQNYTNLDVHVGQSYSFLVTTDQNASSDYYVVASARMDQFDKSFSMNQARSVRWNLSAGAARPNPQGSFRYSSINVTQAYLLRSTAPVTINGRRRATLNGLSFTPPETPLRLADAYGVRGVYSLDFPERPLRGAPRMGRSIINGTYRGFMELIFQNNDTRMQSYHMDGYAFFVVGMDYGEWTEDSRGTYNKGDGVARSTVQVYPGAWAAVLVSLDNVGVWNVRSENLDSWYLGQEVYVRVVNPEDTGNKTEMAIPDNALFCGQLHKQQTPHHKMGTSAAAAAVVGSRVAAAAMLLLAGAVMISP